jgi:Na+:H+ antiporter, NhaA family
VAGVGFTVPLFVADLAFGPDRFAAPVKVGLLAATGLAGVAGWLTLRLAGPAEAAAAGGADSPPPGRR